MNRIALTHQFGEYVPSVLADSVLYISLPYRTAVHLCPCGCGNKVVTPISPADWQLTWDGETISLSPSIGNWGFPCRSHYWITSSQIRWASQWSDSRAVAGRERDDHHRTAYYARRKRSAGNVQPPGKAMTTRPSLLRRLLPRGLAAKVPRRFRRDT
jgi:hypothetical protein